MAKSVVGTLSKSMSFATSALAEKPYFQETMERRTS